MIVEDFDQRAVVGRVVVVGGLDSRIAGAVAVVGRAVVVGGLD